MKIPNPFRTPTGKQPTARRKTGDLAEDAAQQYLISQGLTPVARNYRSRFGEIDLIMQHASTLVFVEVRYRTNSTYGSSAATVTASKQNKIRQTAQQFIIDKKLSANLALRFDVVGMSGTQTQWIKGAFY